MERNISNLILEDREKRYNHVQELSRKFDLPVVCGKLNYPGGNKNTIEANRAFERLLEIVKEKFRIKTVFFEEMEGFDGRSILMVVDMDPEDIKRITVGLEDNGQIGRIFDIDVYIKGGKSIDRGMMNLPPRKCIICEENARICVRTKKHSLEETLNKINKIINNYGG